MKLIANPWVPPTNGSVKSDVGCCGPQLTSKALAANKAKTQYFIKTKIALVGLYSFLLTQKEKNS
jgi:hypothetical protein